MNATETAILAAITDIACHDVKTIAAEIGKSDTTVRKGLKVLEAANKVYRDGGFWYSITESTVEPNEKYTELMDADENENENENENRETIIAMIEEGQAAGLDSDEIAEKVDSFLDTIADETQAEFIAETTDQPAEVESTDVESETASDDAEDAEPEDKPVRKYQRHETPTTRTVRTNQITGAEVQVLKSGETSRSGAVMGDSHKWFAVCLTHNDLAGFSRVLDAHFASSYPEFCPNCKSVMPPEAIGRRRKSNKNTENETDTQA